jgi:hypothetical protein
VKYIFLNHFAFENIDISKQEEDIVILFNEIAYLLKSLKALEYELIFDNKFSQFNFNSQPIHFYLKLIEDKDARSLLFIKIQKSQPFCSDSFDGYYEDENIVLGNCIIKNTDIQILENFLACALFLNCSVITPRTICTKSYFLNSKIEIQCEKGIKELENLFLEDKELILKSIKNNIKTNTDNWDDWIDKVLPNYTNINISENCLKEIRIYSFTSIISTSILTFIVEINNFIKGKVVTNINYKDCCSNTKPETASALDNLKLKNKLKVNNCNAIKEIASWHTYIKKDFRLYFTLDETNNKICFVKFTKKIT